MKINYLTIIDYINDSGRISGFVGGEDTLDDTKLLLERYYKYYADLGYAFVRADVVSRCNTCYGDGTIKKKMRGYRIYGKDIKCPECKGRAEGKEIVVYSMTPDRVKQ